jgi:hypothetical protein
MRRVHGLLIASNGERWQGAATGSEGRRACRLGGSIWDAYLQCSALARWREGGDVHGRIHAAHVVAEVLPRHLRRCCGRAFGIGHLGLVLDGGVIATAVCRDQRTELRRRASCASVSGGGGGEARACS